MLRDRRGHDISVAPVTTAPGEAKDEEEAVSSLGRSPLTRRHEIMKISHALACVTLVFGLGAALVPTAHAEDAMTLKDSMAK